MATTVTPTTTAGENPSNTGNPDGTGGEEDDADSGHGPQQSGSSTTGGGEDPSDASGEEPSSSTGNTPPPITPEPVGCVTAVNAGQHEFTCDGLGATVVVPEQCVTRACGVILDIHGASMTAQQEDNNSNMRALGLEHGYIIVQPTTDAFSWSAGHETRIMTGLYDVMDAFKADRDRIHVMGFSAGGGVTWVILCAFSEVFASAAPAAATGQYLFAAPVCFGSTPPANELDILYMNGETDPFETMTYVGQLTAKIYADWAMGEPTMLAGDGTYARLRRENANGTAFELLTHTYESDELINVPPLVNNQPILGHCYPGSIDHTASEPNQVTGYGCKGVNGFHWGELVIEFFEQNPK